jgi:hypothetical protein
VVAVTEDRARKGSSVGKAQISHSMNSTETSHAQELNSCDRGKTWQQMSGDFTSETKTSGQGKDDANVHVGMNDDGTYTVSVGTPQIKGKVEGSQSSSFSGQCTTKEGKNLSMPATETTIDGNSLTSDGRHRVDPKNPNRLSGSYSNTWQNVTETISWNLEKCGADLRVTDLTFEDMKFPTWDAWREITEQTGTTDGNYVRMKATVFNASAEQRSGEVSFKETYKGDKWDGAKPDMPLKDQTVSVSLEPGEAKDVEILWDSSGYAWFDDGRPRLVQRVKAELWEKNKLVDDITKNLKVAPRPVVLVHGPWQGWQAFEIWQNLFTTTHSYDWKAYPVGEKADKGKLFFTSQGPAGNLNPVTQLAGGLKSYIRYAQEERNAWHVDVVAHSGGGLIARHYISGMMPPPYPDGRPQIARFLMLGTPNLGTPCVAGMVGQAENAGRDSSFLELFSEESMQSFNQMNANRAGVHFGALAGNSSRITCLSLSPGDGSVPVASAHWNVADRAETDSDHEELTSTKNFSEFVKPRLAIGPRADHEAAAPKP